MEYELTDKERALAEEFLKGGQAAHDLVYQIVRLRAENAAKAKRIAELEALLHRVAPQGLQRVETKLDADIRAALSGRG